jgi:hypothetical protein
MTRCRAALLLLACVACGGPPVAPQRAPRHVPERFRDLAAPPPHAPDPAPEGAPDAAPVAVERAQPEVTVRGAGDGAADRDAALVARFELAAPHRKRFVLHGTLPVPRGAVLLRGGRTPLAIRSHDELRTPVPAQVEVVARYPTGEPEVLELLALVELAPDEGPGRRVRFDVLRGDFEAPGVPQVGAPTRDLLDPAGAGLALRTRDVYGNLYRVDLLGRPDLPGFGSERLLAEGGALRRRRTHGALVCVEPSGEGPPLPHLMGVHAYITEWSGDARVTLDLRVHNGLTSGARAPGALESPLGIVYWDALELELPAGWRAEPLVRDPHWGAAREEDGRVVVPIVTALAGGALHMMPPQAQLQRRMTLVPAHIEGGRRDQPFLEGLAFCLPGAGLWSWFAAETGRYFAQRSVLASWEPFRQGELRGAGALRGHLQDELERLRGHLERGAPDGNLLGPLLGWAQPWFYAHEGAAGGVGIVFFEGQRCAAGASAAGYERILLEHRMNASRQAEAQWNAAGDPLGYHGWLGADGKIPFDFRTNGRMVPPAFKLPCFGGPPASGQVNAVHERGLRPPYDLGAPQRGGGRLAGAEESLFNWRPHDGQHFIRYTKNPKALVWLGNDPLARDDVMHSAALFHLQFHESEHRQEPWSGGVTLLQFEKLAATHPRQGLPIDRDQAWGIDVQCAAYSIADPDWRARERAWFERVADLFVAGAMPNGLVSRRYHPQITGGRFDGCQTFEVLFLLHAQRCLAESVLRGTDDARAARLDTLHLAALDYLFWRPIYAKLVEPRKDATDKTPPRVEAGPHYRFAVALHDDYVEPPFSDEERWGRAYVPPEGLDLPLEVVYIWAPLEYGMLISTADRGLGLENRYLTRALQCGDAPGSWGKLVGGMFEKAARSSDDNSGNWAGFVGRLQALGAL